MISSYRVPERRVEAVDVVKPKDTVPLLAPERSTIMYPTKGLFPEGWRSVR